MKSLEVRDVSVTLAGNAILKRISLDVAPGEFISLLGPSGCGKTTLLRSIAGLQSIDTGSITAFGSDITNLPVERRDFGMVFQSLALFTHLSVIDNVTFPLRRQGLSRNDQRRRGEELLALMRLDDMADRSISQVSGGQAQRIALARALAQEPRILLLDEPFSALDAQLREELRTEVRIIQTELALPVIMVTHDQEEALTVSDRVAVMRAGELEQLGEPDELYSRPATAFVADFIGHRNRLGCVVGENELVTESGGFRVGARDARSFDEGAVIDVFFDEDAITAEGEIGIDPVFSRKVGERAQWCVKYGEQIFWLKDLWQGCEARPQRFGLDLNRCFLFERDTR